MDWKQVVINIAKVLYIVLGVLLALPVLFMIDGFISPSNQSERTIGILIIIVYMVGFPLLFFVKISWKYTVILFLLVLVLIADLLIFGKQF
ncbi:hypothetical protein NV379_10705 [Paenibacillus sp. N1-5-1-14]|uniref:hypothetical protein n=1 Tax=Paenibacillus radicibacter TaxID=2972488 RepID=UPI002158C0B1|nr:hypothetical protein [Paenibacillus radicibacter]MCR8643129.1 hypothetical protein [Paenibacillus radicibacter]